MPFKMIRQKIPGLSAWTPDELAAKMKCKCGKRAKAILSCEAERRAGVCAKILGSEVIHAALMRAPSMHPVNG